MPGVRTESEGMDNMARSSDLKRAAELALAGDWDGAHAIAQGDESDPHFCWLHACLHKIQGNTGNSRYWYAKGRPGASTTLRMLLPSFRRSARRSRKSFQKLSFSTSWHCSEWNSGPNPLRLSNAYQADISA